MIKQFYLPLIYKGLSATAYPKSDETASSADATAQIQMAIIWQV